MYNLSGHSAEFSGNKRTYLGTPVLDSLVLRFGELSVELDEALLTVNMERNIVRTFIQGRQGSVKEYVNDGDYEIAVEAKLQAKGVYEFPENYLMDTLEVMEVASDLEVDSAFLQFFGIYNVVVKDYEVKQVPGSRNRLDLRITLYSDVPFEFLILND